MGVDLTNGKAGEFNCSFNWAGWERLLDIAKEFGWQPEGTQPPSWQPEGRGETYYFTNGYQEVTTSDAVAMAAALSRAAASKSAGVMTEKQRELLDFDGPYTIEMIEALANLASRGKFYIG